MGAFVLDADIRLTNVLGLQQIKSQIASAVQGGGTGPSSTQSVSAIAANASAVNKLTQANKDLAVSSKSASVALTNTTQATQEGSKSAKTFGDSVLLAGKRYAGFVAATAIPFAALGILKSGTQSVIEFDASVTKFRQILGASTQEVAGFKQEFIELSVATGTASSEIADIGKILAQAGFRGEQLSEALSQLAKVPLAPSFETINGAVEGTIAALNQFNTEGLSTEDVLDKLTAVSNNFAASSEDIATGLARGGAAFEAIGGNLDEFVAAFATVRQVTRESASSVGTFFKTISSRLADPKITDFLQSKGIDLFGETGEFVGPLEAFRRIGEALQNITNIQDKIDIATKLGGRRQISRLLALVNNVDTLNEALKVSEGSAGAFGKTTEEGLTSLRAQLNITLAELNKLFQTLAEPVFIPLIQGFTAAASASISFVEAISPILPVFGQLIGTIAGIKALTLSVGLLGKSAKILSGIQIGGLVGSLGAAGGAAGNAARIQNRLAGGVGGAAGASTSAALSGVATGIVATGKKLITSQLGQIAVLGVSSVALDFFSEKAGEAGNASAEFALTVAKNLALLVAGISLISGATPGALIGKVFSGLTGALLGVGTVLATSVLVGSQRAKEAIDSTLSSALDKIKSIDFEFENEAEFKAAVGDFGKSIVGRIQDAANQFRDIDTGEQSFGQFAEAASKGLTDLLTGQRGLTDSLITDSQVNQLIDEVIGDNPQKLNQIFEGAVDIFGTEFEKGLTDTLTEAFGGTQEAAQAAQKVVARLIEQQGRAGISTALSSSGQRRREAAEKRLVTELERTSVGLSKIKVPTKLSSELRALNEAVSRTVAGISASSQAFSGLAGSIGEIGAPELGFEITGTAIDDIIKNRESIDEILGANFGNLAKTANEVGVLRDAIDDFSNALVAGESQFFTGDLQQALQDPQVQPSTILEEVISKIADFKELPPGTREKFVAVAKRIGGSVVEGITPDEKIIEQAIQQVSGDAIIAEQQAREAIKQLLGGVFESVNLQLAQESLILEGRAQRTTPEGIFENVRDLAQSLQDDISLPISQLRFGDSTQEVADFGIALSESENAIANIVSVQKELVDSYAEVANSATLSGSEIQQAANRYLEAGRTANETNALLISTIAGLEAERAKLDPTSTRDEGRLQEIDDALNVLVQRLDEARREAVAQGTRPSTPEGIFNSAVDIFGSNVKIFENSIGQIVQAFTRPLTTEDVTRSRIRQGTISAPGAEAFRVTSGGRISSAAAQSQVDVAAFNQAAFGTETLSPLLDKFRTELARTFEQEATAIQIGFDPKSQDELLAKAAQAVADIQVESLRQQGGAIPNEQNISQNIVDLLTGALSRPGGIPAQFAEIEGGTRGGLEAEQAFREESAISVAEGARRLEEAANKTALNLEEIATLSLRFFEANPQATAVTDEQLQAFQSQQLPVGEQTGINQISSASESLRIGSETLQIGSELLQTSSQSLNESSQQLIAGVGELSAVIDLSRQAQADIPTNIDQGGQNVQVASEENIAALTEVQNSLNELSSVIGQRVEQASEPQEVSVEDIEIPGLDNASEATIENSEALSSVASEIESLVNGLSRTEAALEEGVNIDLQATQNLNLNVQGLEGAAQQLKPEFVALAKRVAIEVVRNALSNLASSTSDSLQSSQINNIVEGIT